MTVWPKSLKNIKIKSIIRKMETIGKYKID